VHAILLRRFLGPLTCHASRYFANFRPFGEEDAKTVFTLEWDASDCVQQKFLETFWLADSVGISRIAFRTFWSESHTPSL
jgi:hypothetical protein